MKTHPAYAQLAYRHSILAALVTELRDNYLALASDEPKKAIVCEEVFREDSVVPAEDIQTVVHELEEEAESVRLEMLKFTFAKKDQNGLFNRKKETPAAQKPPPPPQHHRAKGTPRLTG